MKESIKQLFKEIFGLSDEVIEKISAENVEDVHIEALKPEISRLNRAKWESYLGTDTAFTQQFSNKGHAAGLAKGLNTAKDLVLSQLGLKLNAETDEYKDNALFSAKLKAHIEEMTKGAGKGSEELKTALEKARTEFEAEKAIVLQKERETISQDYESKIKNVRENNALKMELIKYASGKALKGGLSLDDILPAIEAKASAYKFEFDERLNPFKVYDSAGAEIENERKDGKLKPSDIIAAVYTPFVDTEAGNGGNGKRTIGNGGNGGGNGNSIDDTLKSQLLDLEAYQK